MNKYLIKGELYNPIKVGDEGDWYEDNPSAVCGDCGSKFGEQHLPNCDIERCPACGGQMISCDCGPIYSVDENTDKNTLDELIEKQRQEIEKKEMLVIFDRNGPTGNIYVVLAMAVQQLRKYRPDLDCSQVRNRVFAAESYDDALKVIGEFVTLLDLSKQSPEM